MQKGNGGDWWRLLKDVARISDMVFCGAPAQLEPLGAFLVPASPGCARCGAVCASWFVPLAPPLGHVVHPSRATRGWVAWHKVGFEAIQV